MKIVADENIPLIENYFGTAGELILKRGRDISRADLLDADILLARSVTKIDKQLLHDTPVKFVGVTATGLDHLDIQWLNLSTVKWGTAYGANATAVVEYVLSTIAALQKMSVLPSKNFRVGVIGVGNIGSKVVAKLKLLGCEVIHYDPLRAEREKDFISTPLNEFKDLDFISLHTPLTHTGEFPTYHMITPEFLQQQKPQCVLLNSSRGAVIDFADLEKYGKHLHWCLDVWEHEPRIAPNILATAMQATPHIAGYTQQSKYRGIDMIYRAACNEGIIAPQATATTTYPTKIISFNNTKVDWRDVILTVYDPRQTTIEMQTALANNPSEKTFDDLRKHFTIRNEFAHVEIVDAKLNAEDLHLLRLLGFKDS